MALALPFPSTPPPLPSSSGSGSVTPRLKHFPYEDKWNEILYALLTPASSGSTIPITTNDYHRYKVSRIELIGVQSFSLRDLMRELPARMRPYCHQFKVLHIRVRYDWHTPLLLIRWSLEPETSSSSIAPLTSHDDDGGGTTTEDDDEDEDDDEEDESDRIVREMKQLKTKIPFWKRWMGFGKASVKIAKKSDGKHRTPSPKRSLIPKKTDVALERLNLPMQHHHAFGALLLQAHHFQGAKTPARLALTADSMADDKTNKQKVILRMGGVKQCTAQEIFTFLDWIAHQDKWMQITECIYPGERAIRISMEVYNALPGRAS